MTGKATPLWYSHAFVLCCLALTLSFLMGSPKLLGQSATTGALTGTVKDSSGAVVPNATVTITSVGTGQGRVVKTSSDGIYKAGFLPPGEYSLKFEADGFSTVNVPSVKINVTETPSYDQVLSVGTAGQQVEVRGEAEAVQTNSATLGSVVGGRTVTDLPLTTRNYTNLLGLAAGANVSVFNAAGIGRGSQDIVVNGAGVSQNNYQQDGASIVSFSGTASVISAGSNPGIGVVNPDAISEFKIQTGQYDAAYGRSPGANVNVVTKSGTNQLHGTAFEFFRNTALNANEYFRKISPPVGGVPNNTKQVLNQNQFGGTLGGPVIKNKLFFFASYQETRQKNGISPAGYSTPTLVGIPQGDRSNTAAFRSALGAAFCPTGTAQPGTRTSVGGVQVACDGTNINPVAVNILQLKNPDGSYFIPSSSTGKNQNVTFSLPATYQEHQAVGNFDYLLNDKNTLSGRWFFSRDPANIPIGCAGPLSTGSGATQCLPGSPGTTAFPAQYSVVKLTSIVSNSLVNELRASLQQSANDPSQLIPFTNTQVGIRPLMPSYDVLGSTTIQGLMQWGGTSVLDNHRTVAAWQIADQISWSHGKHTVRSGFEFERDRANYKTYSSGLVTIVFQTFQDFLIGLPGCSPAVSTTACTNSGAAGTTNGTFSSNLSNTGNSISVTKPGGLTHRYRNPAANAFVQDDFKILSNLTLNLGLRWEYNGLANDIDGLNNNIWTTLINTVPVPGSTPATGTLAGYVVPSNFVFPDYPAPPVGGVFQSNHNIVTQTGTPITNFAPRAGFAWKPFSSDRFVVRGGSGIFYDRLPQSFYNRTSAAPYAVVASRSGAANYFSSLAQPYDPAITLGWAPRWVNLTNGTSSNLNANFVGPEFPTPTTYQWNMNIQYEFLSKWVAEVGYVGSHATKLMPQGGVTERQVNAARVASPSDPIIIPGLVPITTNTAGNLNLRVPYLGFGPAGLSGNLTNADSKYNSLQLSLRKQMSYGLQLQAAYTLSRATSTATYINNNDPLVPHSGANPNYRPHRFSINYSYDLPFGTHQGWLNKVAGGWSLSGVTVVQTGTPLTITDTRGGTIYGFGPGAQIVSTAQFAPGMGNDDAVTHGDLKTRLGGATGGLGYLNKAAFTTIPVIGATAGLTGSGGTGYGNAGYGIVRGPGQVNFDSTIQKTTRVGGLREDANLVFRAEFFNLMNHAQFANPTAAQLQVNNSSFGQITSTSVNPRLIQFALKYVF